MTTIVITGSTRGIGFGLAQQFLERGCNVVISGRSQASVDAALSQLKQHSGQGQVIGQPCDVGDEAQVQALWDRAKSAFGKVDIWLNNAALNAERYHLWDVDVPTLQTIINANIMGTVNGCNVAIRGMKEQGGGYIYNFNGFGSGGETMVGNTPYGITKAAVTYITKALIKETKGLPIQIGTVSPGIVTTELLFKSMDPANAAREMMFLNIVGDTVETVTPALAEQILKHKRHVEWMTPPKILGRFLMAPFRKRNLIPEQAMLAPQKSQSIS